MFFFINNEIPATYLDISSEFIISFIAICMLDENLNLIKCRIIKCRIIKEPYKDGYIEKIYYEANTNIVKKDRYK